MDFFSTNTIFRQAVRLFCPDSGGLASLMWLSLYLAAMRIYQVDECMETYVAKVLSTGQGKSAAGHVTLFQVLLSFVIPSNGRSVDFLNAGRLVMVVIFWLNWLLLAAATGSKLLSRRWFVACLGAGTLAPLWDYGFEIRHDNLMLTGLLLCWGCSVRSRWMEFLFCIGNTLHSLGVCCFQVFRLHSPFITGRSNFS